MDEGSQLVSLGAHEAVDARFEELLRRLAGYRPEADLDLVRRAYRFAADVHREQLRQNGEPYIVHPVEACHILADIEADEVAMAACLLHDTVEDCAQDQEREVKAMRREAEELTQAGKRGLAQQKLREIASREHFIERLKDEVSHGLADEFGPVISKLVAGVTHLSEVRFSEIQGGRDDNGMLDREKEEYRRRLQAENVRRMVVAAAKDLRVLMIKLADRLHNMQTLYAKRRAKQIKIARETELIYAKLADRLGIWRIKWEMEDLALRYLNPEAFFEIERRVNKTREEREAEINAAVNEIRSALGAADIEGDVYGRPKHIYSIYHKMRRQGIDFDDIYDLEAIRVITDTVSHCYELLGIVHSIWPHQPEHFADYISNPKSNGYRSIHTKVIVPGHGPMEIQIRTEEMHRQAEYGVAAHWRYKHDGVVDETFAHKLTRMRQLFEMARNSEPSDDLGADEEGDFLHEFEAGMWDDEVFVFTPKGEVIDLAKGSTVVDFAYRIHTEIGHTTIGAKVNRRIVPLDYVLRNGDQVEILRQQNTGPSRDWLKFVRTRTARNRIRQYFRRKMRDTLVEQGQQALEAEAQRQAQDLKELYRADQQLPSRHRRRATDQPVEDLLTRVARQRGYTTDEDLLTAIGDGQVSAESVVHSLVNELDSCRGAAGLAPKAGEETIETSRPTQPSESEGPISLQGIRNLSSRRSKCCSPIPGDDIVGYLTRGTGLTIHRKSCPNVRHLREREPDRVVDIDWEQTEHMFYDVPVEIRAADRIGLLRDLAGLMSEIGINITHANTASPPLHTTQPDHLATIRLNLELADRSQLEEMMRRLPALGVVKVTLRGQVFIDSDKGHGRRSPRNGGHKGPTKAGRKSNRGHGRRG